MMEPIQHVFHVLFNVQLVKQMLIIAKLVLQIDLQSLPVAAPMEHLMMELQHVLIAHSNVKLAKIQLIIV